MTSQADSPDSRSRQVQGCASGMEIEVCDFGPVAKGKIDLRPLTVFAGPSNTGKSWVATLIYALGRRLKDWTTLVSVYNYAELEQLGKQLGIGQTKSEGSHRLKRLESWRESIMKEGKVHFTQPEVDYLSERIQSLEADLGRDLLRCLGLADESQLVRHTSRTRSLARFKVGQVKGSILASSQEEHQPRAGRSLLVEIPHQISITKSQSDDILPFLDNFIEGAGVAHRSVPRMAYMDVMDYFLSGPVFEGSQPSFEIGSDRKFYYLPAGRGNLVHTLPMVTSHLIRKASRIGIWSDKFSPEISGVSGDFLELLYRTGEESRHDKKKLKTVSSIESRVLKGKVEVEVSETGFPHFRYRPSSWRDGSLPLMSASSMVSELSPVALFLQHWVRPGDTIIFEEPEAHLHPAAQMQLVEEVASWVNAGIWVIVTTHSEWILEKLSNIVHRSLGQDKPSGHKPVLNKEDVGVWLFDFLDPKSTKNGSVITEIPWDLNEAGYEAGFYEAAMARLEDWDEASGSIAEGKPKP